MKGSCRFGAQAAMIRHLVVEKISLTPDFLPYKPGTICKCTVKNTDVLMPFQPMAENASHPVLGTGWSLTSENFL
jgi:hypothetical protein